MRLHGTYKVSLDDNKKRVVRTAIYVEPVGDIGTLLADVRFWIRLPGYEDRIEVKYGERRELSPFYTEVLIPFPLLRDRDC